MTENKEIVPVVIFCYNRLVTLQRLIQSLKNCSEAIDTHLIIYSDGFKNNRDKKLVNVVRKYLKTITGFKHVRIVERKCNYNIEKNITDGLNEIFRNYESAIVLEDDGEVANNFISFMRGALKYYATDEEVMHVGTYTFLNLRLNKDEVFFWRYCENTAGGWGTWRSAWKHFAYYASWNEIEQKIPNAEKLLYEIGGDLLTKSFDKDCVPWDVCWLLSMAARNAVSVHTPHSLVKNNGYINGSHFNWANFLFEGFVYRARFKKNVDIRLTKYHYRNEKAEQHLYRVFARLASKAKLRKKIKTMFYLSFSRSTLNKLFKKDEIK